MLKKMMLKPIFATVVLSCCTLSADAACNIVNGKTYGDCAGVSINKQAKGLLTVSSYVSESGTIEGARVMPGGSLTLSGVCNGDIAVSKGGKLLVTGIVNGSVRNNGGSVEIEGQVSHVSANAGITIIGGTVPRVTGAAKVTYRSGAVVGGVAKP